MFKSQAKAVLIVDADPEFLKQIQADPLAQANPPICVGSGKDAQKILADTNIGLSGIIINPNISTAEPGCLSIARFARQMRSSVPMHLVYEDELTLSEDKLKNLGVRGFHKKPITFQKILELVAPQTIKLEPQKTEASRTEAVKPGEETLEDDSLFVPIRAADFVSGSICNFNVYIMLGKGRYLKLLQSGDSFAPERLKTYLQKGVEFFHLRKEEQERYLQFCAKIAASLSQNKKVSQQAKVNQAMNFGQETMNFLKKQGISEENMTYASDFVENVHAAVENMNLAHHDEFKNFMKDLANYDHGVSTSMITSLIAHVSGIESTSLIQIVGIASMFHDIGLLGMPPEVQSEDLTKMTEEQQILYHSHPRVGAEILSKIPGTHPSVIQAVLQHHERRGVVAFGAKTRAKNLNKVSEIIGIADDFLKLLKNNKDADPVRIQKLLEIQVFPFFSQSVVEAFRQIYCKTQLSKTG